jgi:excisionase family DNA binding protein
MITAKHTMNHGPGAEVPAPLLVTPREAAALLSISERTLWSMTKTGEISVVRIGRTVRYDPHDLRRWIETKKTTGAVADLSVGQARV